MSDGTASLDPAPRPAATTPLARPIWSTQASGMRVRTGEEALAALVWKGVLLTVVTLGIYRFWYRTDLRRWYWRNTLVGGDGFEYRGTPRELFIGFLIALVVTLPLYFSATMAALFVANEVTVNIITAAVVLAIFVLAQYGAYRSRRFRLTRTVWRGLRLDQTGSAWRYAMVSLLWGLATVATAGLLFPLFRRALEGMKVRHTVFGTAEGRFSAPAGGLMLRWCAVWLTFVAFAATGFYFFGLSSIAPDGSREQFGAAVTGLAASALAVVSAVVLWPIYRAAEFRIFTGGSALGPVTLASDLGAGALYGMYIRFGLVTALLLAGGGALALLLIGAAVASIGEIGSINPGAAPLVAAGLLVYIGGAAVFMVLKELLLNRPFWRRAAGSISVSGLSQLAAVTARPAGDDNALGEGFADTLDFGGV